MCSMTREFVRCTVPVVSQSRDPTKVTSQPALTSSSGRVWLIVGAALTAICFAALLLVISAMKG